MEEISKTHCFTAEFNRCESQQVLTVNMVCFLSPVSNGNPTIQFTLEVANNTIQIERKKATRQGSKQAPENRPGHLMSTVSMIQ